MLKLINKYRYITLFKFRNVPIRIHYTLTITLLAVYFYGFINTFFLVAAFSLTLVLLVHELGHMWFANRLGLKVHEINLFLVHGECIYEESDIEYENYVVAWSGIVTQLFIAIPAVILFLVFEYKLPDALSTLLVFLGFYNLLLIAVNLLPISRLDGASCWKAIPLYLKYGRSKKAKHSKATKKASKKKRHLKSVPKK